MTPTLGGVLIALLGPLAVATDDGPLVIAAARERTVLATLAVGVGRPVTVGELVDALWGEDPPATAVKTLQAYVARLRRVLPDGWIVSGPGTYELAVDSATVDARRFEDLVAEGRVVAASGDHPRAADRFEEALALWRGPAPPDLGDHAPGQATTARLVELRRRAEEELVDARLAAGAGADLVADLEAAVRAEPLRERRWGQLMVALYRARRQGEAMRVYQRARAALVQGLGIEPGDELQALERAVIDRDPSLDSAPLRVPDAPTPLPPALAAVAAGPFAGRTRELEAIIDQWQAVNAGACRAVVVHGEPGIGKTRLVAEVGRLAHDDGGDVLFGRCERDALTPYQALVDAVRSQVRAETSSAPAETQAWVAAEIARLVPELGQRLGIEPGPIADDPAARHRLFEAVAAFFAHRDRDRPTVLVVDDLQWIDRGGAAMLRHLLRSAPPRFLVLATFRAVAGATGADLATVAAQLPPETPTVFLPLGGLDADAVRALAGGTGVDAAVLHDDSGGNPLFVAELLRFWTTTGRLPATGDVPAGVRHAVGRRVAELDGPTRRLVETAAVAGALTTPAELADATGVDDAATVELVERAVAGHVLCEEPGAPGRVTFTHDLVRAAILRDLSATRRAHLHRRVADAIAHRTGAVPGARAAELAHHLAAATPAGTRNPEVPRWAIAAGEYAHTRLAWESAAAAFELALAHLDQRETDRRIDLLVAIARAQRAAGHESPARARFTEAFELARASEGTVRAGAIVLERAAIPVDIRRELDEIIAALRTALDDLPAADHPLRAQLMARLAFSLAWAREPDASATADAAVAMARRTGDPVALARALWFATSSRDQFAACDPSGAGGELHELAAVIEDPVLAYQARYCWLTGCIQRGDAAAVANAVDELRALVERTRLVEAEFRLGVVEGHLALAAGRVDDADRVAGDLVARAARIDLRNLALFAGALLYDVRRAQGRLGELLPWFERAAAAGTLVPRLPAMRIQVLEAAARTDEAARALADHVGHRFSSVVPAERPHSLATLADVAVAIGDASAAAALRRELAPWSSLVVYDGTNGPLEPVDRYLARLDDVVAGGGQRVTAPAAPRL